MTNELGTGARALIDQAYGDEVAPPRAELERIRRNVVAGAASSAVMLSAPHAAGLMSGMTPFALFGMALKGGIAGTAVVLSAFSLERFVLHPELVQDAAGVHEERRAAVPARATVAEPARAAIVDEPLASPGATKPQVPKAVAQERVGTARRQGESARAVGSAVSSMETSADLREEAALLRRVQQELRAGRGAEALRLLDASSARLERGQLRQERLAAEVLAACQLGDVERARRGARAFAAENPATPSAARLRSSCVGSEFFEK